MSLRARSLFRPKTLLALLVVCFALIDDSGQKYSETLGEWMKAGKSA